jgi:hypothetical protein
MITPTVGFSGGGELIKLYGNGFIAGDGNPVCLFGSTQTPVTIVNQTHAYCRAPSHPSGQVIVTLKLFGGEVIAQSTRTYVYENKLNLLDLYPFYGEIQERTLVTMKFSDLGAWRDDLLCQWNYTFTTATVLGKLGPFVVTTPATRLNATHCSCLSVDVNQGYIDKSNHVWYTESNGTAALSLTKNLQSYSNALIFHLISKPNITSITPKFSIANEDTVVTIYGNNFVRTKYTTCKIGSEYYFPALIKSQHEAVCTMKNVSIKPSVHQVEILGGYFRVEQQSLEVWENMKYGPHHVHGYFMIDLEGYQSRPIDVSNLTSDILMDVLNNDFPRVKNVTVTSNSLYRIDLYRNLEWYLTTYNITFHYRQDNMDAMTISYNESLLELDGDDYIRVTTVTDGGSDTSVTEIQQYTIETLNPVPQV